MSIIQNNPSYFEDDVQTLDMHPSFYKKYGFRHCDPSPPVITGRRREPLSSEDTDGNELDVFLSSYESNGSSCFADQNLMTHPLKETSFGTNRRTSGRNGSTSSSDQIRKGGFSQKFGQFFWKSKSKHSLGSESHVSGSTIESNGPISPRFTPDSSLSIYTNSCEGDRDSSNSSNSNQISPKDEEGSSSSFRGEKLNEEASTDERDHTTFYRFDDCERYAANMYYNVGDYTTCRVQQSRPRNNSVPVAQSEAEIISRDNTNTNHQDYYRNPTFSTFPNPRRHSIGNSSGFSENDDKHIKCKKEKQKKYHQIIDIQHDKDGYLRPNEPRNSKNLKNAYYINEPQSPSVDGSKVQVHVDVHSPAHTSASSLNSKFEAFNSSADKHSRYNNSGRDFETSTTTDDSQSTILADSICSGSYVPQFYPDQNAASPFEVSKCQTNETKNNSGKISSDSKFAPVCLSRIRRVIGTDCEPYCSLCGITSTMVASTFKSKMDVAIVSCHECFFSKNAEMHIRGFLDKLVTPNNQKMDVKLQSYDMKDLEHSKVAADVHQSKVQIVLISHHFLQRLKLEARVRGSPVNRVFRSKRVIAILAGGVHHKEIVEGYQTELVRFGEWFWVELRSTCKLDLDFSKKFTDHFVKIYNLEQSNTSNFTVFPKKVTRDQPKLVIILKKPIEAGDEVRVDFSCGRKTESSTFTKIENAYTLSVRVPDSLCPEKIAYVEISVYLNCQKLGATCIKADMHGRICDDDVVEKMTKMVPGFLKLLDEHIKQTLIKNYRECTDYLIDPSIELMNDVLICKGDEFPTIMHFAAYYGLEHTVFTVLDEADGLEQCKVLNDNDMKPLDLAEYRNHDNVAQIINDYHLHQEISASCKAYQMIKNIYARDSVLELRKKEIVSKSKRVVDRSKISLPSYENLPETAITESEKPEENTVEGSAQVLFDDQKSNSSAGSYISWNFNQSQNSAPNSEETDSKKPIQKPKPTARSRSPRSKLKKDYVNVEGENVNGIPEDKLSVDNTAAKLSVDNTTEEVLLRHPRENKLSRDHLRRKSISPIQNYDMNYDIPRFANEEYSIPPPEARPVNPGVLVKKTTGSIPVTNDGYLIMDHEEENGEMILKEHLRYQEGTFVAVQTVPLNRELQSVQRADSTESTSTSPEVKILPESSNETPKGRKNSRVSEPNIALDPVDEELINLMKDFTSAGYTIQQIELLFENWKCRPDVQRSIEDKKSYMKKVREEYKRLQSNQTTKGASILDKIKVVLTGKKKNSVTTSPKFSMEDIHRLQSRPSADRESFGSHGSGSGNSVPDSGVSGVSELDIERDKDPINYDSNSPKVYRNPLDRRFIPSYVPRELPNVSENEFPSTSNDTDYQIPPPPRPIGNPPVPQKPARKVKESGSDESSSPEDSPPALPQKPNHLKGIVDDDPENPPPPPPRTYIKPNPFNYIDYSQRSRGESPNKPVVRSLSPYDNLKEDKP